MPQPPASSAAAAPPSVLADVLARVGQALAAFRAAPSATAEAALREQRNALARILLGVPGGLAGAGLRWLGVAPQIDRVLDLMCAGLRVQPPGDEEMALAAAARACLADAGADGDATVAATVVFCLLRPPHRLPRLPDWGRVPVELLDLAVRTLYVEPEFFVGLGEAELGADYMERLTLGILEAVENGLPLPFRRELAMRVVFHGRFLTAYFSERNLRALYRARARIYEFYLETAGHALDTAFPPRPAGRTRLRVGVLRQAWHTSAETAATLAHVNGLDRDRFELVFYALQTVGDPMEAAARARTDRFAVVNGQNVAEAVRQIRADDLDILLIGTNVTAGVHFIVLLSAFRLARAQVALTLSPATTGFRSVGYFLNGALNEPADAQEEYTERLLLVPGSINHYDFTGEAVPDDAAMRRADLDLPEDAFVFASGANFFKLVPELLDSWSRILRATPGSRLVLYPFNPNWTNVYPVELFSRHLRGFFEQRGVEAERIRIVKPQPSRAHIHALLRCADLYLDSFPYSGAVSVLDPAGVGCPIVMRAGRPARNRQSAGMHAEAGLGAVVAGDAAAYEAEAIRLAADRAAWTGLRVRAIDARDRVRRLVRLDLNAVLAGLAAEVL